MTHSPEIDSIIENAIHYSKERKHQYVTVEHLLLSLVTHSSFKKCLVSFGADVDSMSQEIGASLDSLHTTVMLSPVILTRDGHFGARTNQFGFTISGSSGMVVVVEAGTTLAHPNWSPLLTNTLTSASFYFSDPDWTNHPARFYRLRSP